MSYSDYEQLKNQGSTSSSNKRDGLLKNPVHEIDSIRSDKDLFQEQVAVSNANKDFAIDETPSTNENEVVGKESLNADELKIPVNTLPPLTKNVSDSYAKKANKMLQKVDLHNYRGGIYTLDGAQYNYDELAKLMEILYGRESKKKENMKISGKNLTFIKALYERNLKKYVKNKSVFKFVDTGNWWNLAD